MPILCNALYYIVYKFCTACLIIAAVHTMAYNMLSRRKDDATTRVLFNYTHPPHSLPLSPPSGEELFN